MPTPSEPHKNELQSTYFVQDRQNKAELTRLTIQDQMITKSMGGVLPEQADAGAFRRVLDVGCGPGGWAIEAAITYPSMSLVGIDISEKMLDYARKQARARQVAGRVEFRIMDALKGLEFPPASFDLVNMRLAVSFVRTWDWLKLLGEIQRVTRNGGIIRLTEADIAETSSPALNSLNQTLRQAFYTAGNFFTPHNDGLTSQLTPMLARFGLEDVQAMPHILTYRAGTPEGQRFIEEMQLLYRTTQPFIQKWTNVLNDYDALYEQALTEMRRPDFVATWKFVTVWGKVVASS